jgi:hypothetical protein
MSEVAGPQSYLKPYLNAAGRHGDGFESLLWASPATQALRFEALARLCNFTDMNLLDAGCGRADFLDFLIARKTPPGHYVGIEAIDTLAGAAVRKRHRHCSIIHADFVRDPARLLVGADAIVFCGSLNTLTAADFYTTLDHAFSATADWLLFNFLCSPQLAHADWLTWHKPEQVQTFVGKLTSRVSMLNDYFDGDCTVALRKDHHP